MLVRLAYLSIGVRCLCFCICSIILCCKNIARRRTNYDRRSPTHSLNRCADRESKNDGTRYLCAFRCICIGYCSRAYAAAAAFGTTMTWILRKTHKRSHRLSSTRSARAVKKSVGVLRACNNKKAWALCANEVLLHIVFRVSYCAKRV